MLNYMYVCQNFSSFPVLYGENSMVYIALGRSGIYIYFKSSGYSLDAPL